MVFMKDFWTEQTAAMRERKPWPSRHLMSRGEGGVFLESVVINMGFSVFL